MTQNLEIARYCGFNLWYNATAEGATIHELIEQYYKWDIENDPFPWNANPKKLTKRRNCYELANIHFELDENIISWIQNNRPLIGREGDEYITLNKGDLLDVPSSVSNIKLPQVMFHLDQNYPNPFNYLTNIKYELRTPTHATLKIYDILGQEIETLVNEYQNKGLYQIRWSATGLPSGVYLCRLQAGEFSEAKKLVLQK
jgi:hypothetical protein